MDPIYSSRGWRCCCSRLRGFLLLGSKQGRTGEVKRQADAKSTAEETSKRIIGDAEREAESTRKSAVIAGKEEQIKLRESWEAEARHRREEIEREERRLDEQESQLEKKLELVEGRDKEIGKRASDLGRREKFVVEREQELEKLATKNGDGSNRSPACSQEQAKAELMQRMEAQAEADAANRLREIRESAKRDAEREAKKIVALAVQRIASEHTSEISVSAVSLPSDEMKGRIIGREGRNIRAFELATGVDVVIDDTPDTVVVSCFDPVRREIARLALEKLVADGRIHPGRIEEVVAKSKKEVEAQIVELGRTRGVRNRDPRPASGDDQADRTDEVPDELRPEHPRPLQGSRAPRRDHGGRVEARRHDGQARRPAARRRARCSRTSTRARTCS